MKEMDFTVDIAGSLYPAMYIKSQAKAEAVVQRLLSQEDGEVYGLDLETAALPEYRNYPDAALSPHLSVPRLLQLFTGRTCIVFDCYHIVPETFVALLQRKSFVAHYAKFDLQYLYNYFKVRNVNIGCTQIATKLIYHATLPYDEGTSASLESVAGTILNVKVRKESQASNWAEPELTFEQVEYAAMDPALCYLIARPLLNRMNSLGLGRTYKLYKDAQHPIVTMQLNGLRLNVDRHREMMGQWKYDLIRAKQAVQSITGLATITPHTIADYLESTLDKATLDIWPKTDAENPKSKLSTDAKTLADFSYLELVKPFSIYQKKLKLTTTYGQALINQINPVTGRLHGNYNIAGARTGRLSCSRPNLQNAPRDPEFRANFIADEGCVVTVADYSSVEVRAMAEVSNDVRLLEGYVKGIDIYRHVASQMLNKPVDSITKEERQKMKAIVLGLQFGLGAPKLGKYAERQYGVHFSDSESQHSVDQYRELYAGVRVFQLAEVQACIDNGYTSRTLSGKLRKYDPQRAFGNVINHVIQGSAAEAMLQSCIYLHEKLDWTKQKLLASIHDETKIQCPEDMKEETCAIQEDCMTRGYASIFTSGRTLINLVSAHAGKNWAEAKD